VDPQDHAGGETIGRTAIAGFISFFLVALDQLPDYCPLCFANVFNKTGSLENHIKKYHPWFYDEWIKKGGARPHASDDGPAPSQNKNGDHQI